MSMEQLIKKEELQTFFQPPSPNDIVKGKIIGQERLALFVNLGSFGTGIVYGKEFFKAKKMMDEIKKGDEVKAKIIEIDGKDGYTEVSVTKAWEEMIWNKLKKMKEEREPIKVTIQKANKGGLIASVNSIQGFLPVSHLSPEHYPKVEGGDAEKILHALQEFIGEEMKVVVLDIDREEESLILSEKKANLEKTKELMEEYEVGDTVEGKITGVVEFGAFIKFPYPPEEKGQTVEGLIHISELDWQLIEDPRDVVSEGDVVKAKIIDVSQGRISLSLKALKKDPWQEIDLEKGDVVTGKVTKFNPFGAFVEIEPKVQGLIHISEFNTEEKMQEELRIGEEYEFEITLLDPEEHRMILKLNES